MNNAGYVEASLVEEARYGACEDTKSLRMVYTLTLVTSSAMTDSSLSSIPPSFGTLAITQTVLPHFREKKAGIIASMGSVGG